MVQSSRVSGRKRCGSGSSRRRHSDTGSPSSDTAWSRKPQRPRQALRPRHALRKQPETVAKWNGRNAVHGLPTGPKQAQSTVLSAEDEAVVVAFRRHTLLPLDDCLYALQATLPHLTRSSLHRCLQRHSISRLPEAESARRANASSRPIRSAASTSTSPRCRLHKEGSICWLPATGSPNSPLSNCTRRPRGAAPETSSEPSSRPCLAPSIPCRPTTARTSPGTTCSATADIRRAMNCAEPFRAHAFEHACAQNHIDHRLTKPRHPCTNGPVERMNRTLKEATVTRFHYRHPRPAPEAPRRLRPRLQPRSPIEDPQGPHPSRSNQAVRRRWTKLPEWLAPGETRA